MSFTLRGLFEHDQQIRLAVLREVREKCGDFDEEDMSNWGIESMKNWLDAMIAKEESK